MEGKEPWPEDNQTDDNTEDLSLESIAEEGETPTMEWDVTPNEDDQPSLFEEGSEEE
jgi:hypothetical protein